VVGGKDRSHRESQGTRRGDGMQSRLA
jgi:hypothetical protein